MSLIAKLLLSLVIAILASTLTNLMLTGEVFAQPLLLLSFFVATAATALIVGAKPASTTPSSTQVTQKPPASDASRDHGTVKWFNVSKGFGFIVKDDGEEIFVHFRSIRGEGRRSLRDGQSVSFIVAESDKGPQAEDVMGED
jgi:CspA family cold shock protein